jgi:hypothetical protein
VADSVPAEPAGGRLLESQSRAIGGEIEGRPIFPRNGWGSKGPLADREPGGGWGTVQRVLSHDLSRVSLGFFGAFLSAMKASAALISQSRCALSPCRDRGGERSDRHRSGP